MNIVILLLLLCSLLVPLVFVSRQCFFSGKIEINHVLLFSIGFIVYWISPIAIGESQLFSDVSAMPVWYGLFDKIPQDILALYLLMCLSIYGAFCAGTLLCQRLRPGNRTEARPFFFDRRLLNVFLGLGVAAEVVYAVLLRNDFFRGYTTGDASTNVGTRGSFVAISVFLLSLALLYSLKRQEKSPGISFRSAISHHFFAVYLVAAVMVLSLGGRLYSVSSILMLLVYRSVYFQRITYRSVLLIALSALALSGTIGTLRLGSGLSLGEVAFNLVSEPLFNSFSLLQFLVDGRLNLVSTPIFLASDFINLIPSAVFPQKAEFLLNPEDYGYHVFSPLGSQSTFFSFIINFGVFGSMLFMFGLAFSLQTLRARGRSLLSKTIYIMVCGWLATTFFRDPFSVSLVKSIFQYSILFPAIVVFTAGLTTYFLVEVPPRAAELQ